MAEGMVLSDGLVSGRWVGLEVEVLEGGSSSFTVTESMLRLSLSP